MTHMRFWERFRLGAPRKETTSPLVERVEALERDNKRIRLEWEDTYESMRNLVAKLNKREKRALQEETVESPAVVGAVPQTRDELRRWARANGQL